MAAVERRRGIASVPVEKALLWKAFCDRYNLERSAFCVVLADWLAAHQEDPPAFLAQLIADTATLMADTRARD